jgi:hypothetical protein
MFSWQRETGTVLSKRKQSFSYLCPLIRVAMKERIDAAAFGCLETQRLGTITSQMAP